MSRRRASSSRADRLGLLLTTRLGYRFKNRPAATPESLAPRIEILQRTSMRSVAALASEHVTWVIQTDPSLCSFLRASVADGTISTPASVTIHVVGREGLEFDQDDVARIGGLPDRFLCARLDSDDFYLPLAIGTALERTDLADQTLIDFPRGFLVNAQTGLVRRHSYVAQGPFYGIVTNPNDPLPAVGNHEDARSNRPVKSVMQRSWLQTVHAQNYFTSIDSASVFMRARTMRRELVRHGSSRPRHESASRILDLLPIRSSRRSEFVDAVS